MLFPLYDRNPHHRFPWVTLFLIVANLAALVWLTRLAPRQQQQAVAHFGFIPLRLSQLDEALPVQVEMAQGEARPKPRMALPAVVLPPNRTEVLFSLLTMMFLHGGWLHLVSNMWMLWIFGNNIEDRLGHFVFLAYYLVGGILATLCHWVVEPQSAVPVIGASGAVAAVLGGYAVSYPTAKVRTLIFFGLVFITDLPALLVLGAWFLLQMAQGLGMVWGALDVPVAFWAHIGGFLAGIALLPLAALGAPPAGQDWKTEAEEVWQF